MEGGELIHKPFSSAKAGENSAHIEMIHSGPCNQDAIANVCLLGQAQASIILWVIYGNLVVSPISQGNPILHAVYGLNVRLHMHTHDITMCVQLAPVTVWFSRIKMDL